MSSGTLLSETLKEIIRRIVDIAKPERIIMFGSFARGDMNPNSDVDFLVVKGGNFDYHKLLGDIYMNLHGVEKAVDIVLATPEQVEKYKDTHCLVISSALKDGKEVYHA